VKPNRSIPSATVSPMESVDGHDSSLRESAHMSERAAVPHTEQARRTPPATPGPKANVATPAPPLGNRAMARSVAQAPGRPAGRGLRPEGALLARLRIQRTATTVKSSNGEFSIDHYDEVDTDKDSDTRKKCGVNIEVTFHPPEGMKSNKIAFVQMMKCLKGDGTPLLFANESPRATDDASGDAGWAVDRLAGNKWGYYGMDDAGTAGGNLKLGSRTDKTTFVDAWMHDKIQLTRDAGKSGGCTAMTFAIDVEHGTYLGGFGWGYSVDASGKVTKNKLEAVVMGDVQRAAIKGWNTQAKLDDATKRNAPAQELLPAAPGPMGDFPMPDPNAATQVG
jgi:hypothetical protein